MISAKVSGIARGIFQEHFSLFHRQFGPAVLQAL